MQRARRGRRRRWRGRGGTGDPAGTRRARRRRARAGAGVALASGRGLRLAARGRCPATHRARRSAHRSLRAADPGDAVSTPAGSVVALTYGAEDGRPDGHRPRPFGAGPGARRAGQAAGAEVRRGVTVAEVRVNGGRARLTVRDGDAPRSVEARVVVGADGPHSVVGRAASMSIGRCGLPPRIGLSFHLADPRGDAAVDARLAVFRDGYVGIAPVPGGRVNIGIVLGPTWQAALRADGAAVRLGPGPALDRADRGDGSPAVARGRSTGRPTRSPERPHSASVPRGGPAQAGSSSAMPPASWTR